MSYVLNWLRDSSWVTESFDTYAEMDERAEELMEDPEMFVLCDMPEPGDLLD